MCVAFTPVLTQTQLCMVLLFDILIPMCLYIDLYFWYLACFTIVLKYETKDA